MSEISSAGKCLYCNKEFSNTAIARHLNIHLAEKAKEGKPGKSFHVKIKPDSRWGSSPYFLNLWVDGEATIGSIDDFLRRIWLECCGHLSAFRNPKLPIIRGGGWDYFEAEELLLKGKQAAYEKLMEESNGEVPKSRKTKIALHRDLKLNYEYDFGSTTALQLMVLEEYPVKADKPIILLSRNEPPQIMCEDCGKNPATKICCICMNDDTPGVFCFACAKKHAKACKDFADYAAMPVVNSPRMGVCAYEGGEIDKKRDGVFTKK